MKAFTVAAVQIAPLPGPLTAESVKGNLAKAADWVTRAVDATGAELVVLPESVTTGFTPGIGPEHAIERAAWLRCCRKPVQRQAQIARVIVGWVDQAV